MSKDDFHAAGARTLLRTSVVTVLAALAATSVAAQAQPASTPDETASQDIIVTGSMLARSTFNTPTPVTVLGSEQISRQAVTNVAQILDEVPAFRAQSSPSTTNISISNLGASTADLRGLGANRTLVLIDGRRVVASTVAGGSFTPANTVDLNMVPSSLLKRVEVVTGGASAVYGSDAVAGVVNLIIDRDLTGLKASAQYGISQMGDNAEFMASLAYGTRFADDRGSLVIGGEYVNNKGTGDCYQRTWCAESYNVISNPVDPLTGERVVPGEAAQLILPNARTATSSINGMVVAGPLRGLEFNADGSTFMHDYGMYTGTGLFQSGGGDPMLPFYQYFATSSPSERINIFGNLDFQATDDLKLFVQGAYGRVTGDQLGAARRDISPPGSYQIKRDNAYLPADVGAAMDAAGVSTLPFGRMWDDLGPQAGSVKRETIRAVAGFDYDFAENLSLSGYYQYGRSKYRQRGYNTTINSHVNFAMDPVVDPISGQIVCRATLPGPGYNAAADGCVPVNPFGFGAPSDAAHQYLTGTTMQDSVISQHVAALTLRGDLAQLWAGPLSFALGGEYRHDKVSSVVDPISAANDFYTSPGAGIVGGSQSMNVKEAFIEAALPLVRDVPMFNSLEVNGAARITDYSTSGSVKTWKIGGDWGVTDFFRLRATRSRDIRAPNLFELYGAPQSSFQAVDYLGARLLIPTQLRGNAALQPEVAKTFTVGGVLTGDFGSSGRLSASVDWYDISLDGAISTLGGVIILSRCLAGAEDLCQFLDFSPDRSQLLGITDPDLNLNTLITRGWDIEADYTVPLNSGSSIGVRVLATVVKDLITIDTTGAAVNRAGQNGSAVSQPSGLPDYTINGYLTYSGDPFSVQLQVRHISSGRFQSTNVGPDEKGYDPALPNSINVNKVPAYTYVNMNAQLKVNDQFQVFGVISNLFDKDPPNKLPSSMANTNPVLYDVVGRSFRFGVRADF